MTRALRHLPLALILTSMTFAGCKGCGGNPFEEKDGGDPNFQHGDGGGTSSSSSGGSGSSSSAASNILAFNDNSPVTIFLTDGRDLSVTLKTPANDPIVGSQVTFSLDNTLHGGLATDRVNTNSNGVASVRFTANSAAGDAVLTASANGATSANLVIQVRSHQFGLVRVNATSAARVPVTNAEVLLYATAAGTTAQTCSNLLSLTTLPTASFTGTIAAMPGSTDFTAVADGNTVAAMVKGYNAGGDYVAKGCVDNAAVSGGQTTNLNVTLNQLPSVLAGSYDVLMSMDLGNALPQPYEDYVDFVTIAVSDPAAVLMYYTLQAIGGNYLNNDSPDAGGRRATLPEVVADPNNYNTWRIGRDVIDSFASSQLGQNYADFRATGTDIRRLVTQFEVGSHLVLTDSGANNQYGVQEQWRDIVFTWHRGCALNDEGCARRPVELVNTQYAPVNVQYNAGTAYEPLSGPNPETERYKVTPDVHNVPFSYGALILIALNELVFPGLTGCTNCHSLTDVLAYIINCHQLAVNVDAQIHLGVTTLESACNTGINAIGTYLTNEALNLQFGAQDVRTKGQGGIGGGGQFYLVDADKDLRTELVKELQMYVQWQDQSNPQQTQDLTAPITGHGRMSATHCATDSACNASQSCQLVPHYLEVKKLETTCKRAVGTVNGGDDCLQDNVCRSGMCIGESGQTPGKCFHSCVMGVAGQCGAGVCVADRASMNLNSVRAGLGDGTAAACNP